MASPIPPDAPVMSTHLFFKAVSNGAIRNQVLEEARWPNKTACSLSRQRSGHPERWGGYNGAYHTRGSGDWHLV